MRHFPPSQVMKVRIEPGFAAFALLLYALAGELVWPLFLAAGLHELAHLLALYALGGRAEVVTLRFADARITMAPMGYAAEIVCALAGPAANFLCFALWRARAPAFAAISLLLSCYNLLPVLPLDGGRAVFAAVSLAASPITAQKLYTRLSAAACAALTLTAAYAAIFCGAGVWPLLAMGALALRLTRMGREERKTGCFSGAARVE